MSRRDLQPLGAHGYEPDEPQTVAGDVYRVLPPDYPRTVRLVAREADGRWLVENVGNGRKTRVSDATLATKWERVKP